MRRFGRSIGTSLARETSHRFWAFVGVEWVVVPGIFFSLFLHHDGSAPIRIAFYEIVVVLIPVLLGIYLRERRAEIRVRADISRRAQEALQKVDRAAPGDDAVLRLHDCVEASRQLLRAAIAYTALIPAAALTGEAIALLVIASGASTDFSFTAVLMAAGLSAIGAVLETAHGLSRAID